MNLTELKVGQRARVTKLNIENRVEVVSYQKEAAKKSEFERTEMNKDKTGVMLKGVKAINPVNGKEIPVWI